MCLSSAMCVKHQAEIKTDWTNLGAQGYGLNKRNTKNERIAQWKSSGKRFSGGVYKSIFNASDYHEAANIAEMMTWTVLCAKHGAEAMIADVNAYCSL